MQRTNKNALQTPIMGRVIELNKYVLDKRTLLNKTVRNTYYPPLLAQCEVLFTQALRQLRGKDYLKRAEECLFDIQSKAYLLYTLNAGWNLKIASIIDNMCDDICSQLVRLRAEQSARTNKLNNEVR